MQSGIHGAFLCQDIAELIFSHFSPDPLIAPCRFRKDRGGRHLRGRNEERERRHTLTSAARVSKFISEIVLSVLWSQLYDFGHLFRVLPQYRLGAYNLLDGEPRESDWARLEIYAKRVRVVHCFYAQHYEIRFLDTLLDRYDRDVSRLFPCLTGLGSFEVGYDDDDDKTLFSPPILTPTLQHLTLDLATQEHKVLTSALTHVTQCAPSLSSLKIIYTASRFGEPVQAVDWQMMPLNWLQELDITLRLNTGSSALATISLACPRLQALSVRVLGDCANLTGCFQSLTHLWIGGDPSDVRSFLAATSPPLLQHLEVFITCHPPSTVLAKCIAAVLSHVPQTLSVLVLESSRYVEAEPGPTSVLDLIQPALALRALTRFTCKFHPISWLSDDDVVRMLNAWPSLTALCIGDWEEGYPDPDHDHDLTEVRPTARVLPAVIEHGPHLRCLVLPEVDLLAAFPGPAADEVLPGQITVRPEGGHPLQRLELCWKCEDEDTCARVAGMIDSLFPSLDLSPDVGRERSMMGGANAGWDTVVRMVGELRAGRAKVHGN